MSLQRVTITGADDSTAVQDLIDISAEFPFVEWGILVSKRQEGSFRFPSREWIEKFSAAAFTKKLKVSTHVCGRWVREMFTGDLDWRELPDSLQVCQRIQINTHAEPHVSTTGLIRSLLDNPFGKKEYIFQWDGVNNHLTYAAHAYGVNVSALFDTSGGAGILPQSWPTPSNDFWCGYAGGLGPDNVVNQIRRIESVCDRDYWIDMERRVRTADDSRLELGLVRSVLKQTEPLLEQIAF